MSDETTIETATPERLVVRRRAGRGRIYMFLVFGGFSAMFAVMATDEARWAAAGLAALNFLVAWFKASQTIITFDRPSGTVECAEMRPLFARKAVLPLDEFTGAQFERAPGNLPQSRLGLATRKGVIIPIEQSFAPGERTDVAKAIDAWLGAAKPPPADAPQG